VQKPLQLRFLGEIEILRGSQRMELPPSKKTRALLAYLAVTRRGHRRDRLCGMFWDITDDPRAALRWSLSKLRPLVDEPGKRRIVADGEGVVFELAGASVDLFAVREQFHDGKAATTELLALLAQEFRGEFLEGLELPDFHDFQAWCVAQREEARRLHARILTMLVGRLGAQPDAALSYARTLVQVDPLNEHAHAALVRLLGACGRRREAEQQFEMGNRVLRELGAGSHEELSRAWHEVSQSAGAVAADVSPATTVLSPAPDPLPTPGTAQIVTLVGRQSEWSRLSAALEETARERREHAVLLNGEPGIGKTRLLSELMAEVRRRHGTVLNGGAYEAETGRPYGPWIDALRRVPAVSVGDTLGADLAPLLPELGHATAAQGSRDRLFGAVVELIAARAHSAPPVVLVLDDVQWCDGASAELLHYVARMNRHRPVLLALAARDGELQDNEPMRRVLRGLRHDNLLDEIDVGPLSGEETALLVRDVAPRADLEQVFVESAGNPLFALEVARSLPRRQGDVPPTLRRLVRDRIERLPPDAADILRWAAVVGQTFRVRRLSQLAPIDSERLVAALEILERLALLHAVPETREPGGTYAFAHDVVRQVVYAELSAPRRRLMHLHIARALQALGDTDETAAADLARHAALAGEADTAARACVTAGRRCLRLFASTEADALARRGMHYAERLAEPDRVKLLLELIEIRFAARRPPQPDEAAHAIEQLAERALEHGCLEHARLGFHLLSYLRWEGGEWSDAQRHMMRAEQVSRSADERERVVAIAEAARCLTMLERDLGHAEALLLEAGALSRRLGMEPTAIPDAVGMLRLHEGRLDEAAERFTHARDLCRKDLDRLGEFRALEHLVILELQREGYATAQGLSAELVGLADRLREGSEAPSARTLAALSRYALGAEDARAALDTALAELRVVDAKHRLASALISTAEIDVRRGDAAVAQQRAEEALRIAALLQCPSAIVLARVAVARAAALQGDSATCKRQLSELHADGLRGVSFRARNAVEQLRAERIMPTRSGRS
jgi:DNA-binding SARP family transcriptional activator